MLKAYKYRIYPNDAQKSKIDKTLDICRLVYNIALEVKIEAYRIKGINISSFELSAQLTQMKKEFKWMHEFDSQPLISSVMKVDQSFKNFFNGNGFPRYKSKKGIQSFQCQHNTRRIDWENKTLTIPKIKDIPIRLSRKFEGKIKSVTISRSKTKKYFASILVDNHENIPDTRAVDFSKLIGLDTGIKSYVVSSDGRYFDPNRKLKDSLLKLQKLSRRLSKKRKGSSNRKKACQRLALLHEKISNQRLDYIHKVTHSLTSDSQAVTTIVIENLNIKGLLANRRISQAMSDISLGKFYLLLDYKCRWRGINLIKISRFAPTSKRCFECGAINSDLTLSMRTWTCLGCGSSLDRDFNASRNIAWYGQQLLLKKMTGAGSSNEPVESRSIERA